MAEILNESFLREVFKQVTFASKEFEMPNAFILMEKDAENTQQDIPINPYTGEPLDPTFSNPVEQTNIIKETIFSAELEKVSEVEYRLGVYGQMPAGTQIILVNSQELDEHDLSQDRFQNSIGIKMSLPEQIDMYGKSETSKKITYIVKSVQPNFLKDKLLELAIFVEYAEETQ